MPRRNRTIWKALLPLGLLAEPEAVAGRAITAQGVQLDTVRRTVTAELPAAAASVPVSQRRFPLSGCTRKRTHSSVWVHSLRRRARRSSQWHS